METFVLLGCGLFVALSVTLSALVNINYGKDRAGVYIETTQSSH